MIGAVCFKVTNEYEDEFNEIELDENGNYNFHKGCCETSEIWMKAIGVSPQCNFIIDRLYN